MLGAIIGDIVGSTYEVLEIKALQESPSKKRSYKDRIQILSSKTPLFNKNSSFTDDSILTISIASAILKNEDYESSLRLFGNNELSKGLDRYGRLPFSPGFVKWLKKEKVGDSLGNGGAMRISSIALYFDTLEEVLEETKKATIPSHNSVEAIIGAQAVSTAIYLASHHKSKEEIKNTISSLFSYNLQFDLNTLQHEYRFTSKTSNSVPQAIYCFLISDSFENALRISLSIGGDSDTIAAITCAISEAYYGIPSDLKEQALTYLTPSYRSIVQEFYEEITLKKALSLVDIKDQYFLNYMKTHTKKYNIPEETGIWGCFITKDDDNLIQEVKIIVPNIINEKTLLINIHEYTHAYEIYKRLGTIYDFNDIEEEQKARNNEDLYLKKRVIN